MSVSRLTLSQAYANLLEVLGLVLTKQSHRQPTEEVALSRNAKGDTQIVVSGQAHEDETLTACAERVAVLYEQLRARFPPAGDGLESKLRATVAALPKTRATRKP
jgi:hypothetical protein